MIKNFTGIDSPYKPPEQAQIQLAAGITPADELAEQVIEYLKRHRYVDASGNWRESL
ncbi:hypothetical protein SMD10_09690 [Consotaella sp. CSK11QG-6]